MPSDLDSYDPDPDLAQFSQGDVIQGIPFPTWPTFVSANELPKMAILRALRTNRAPSKAGPLNRLPNYLEGRAQRDVPDAFQNDDRSEYVMGRCSLRNLILISRSCSLDNPAKKHIVVAPVISIGVLPEAQRSEGKLNDLRAGRIPHLFYLAPTKGLDESFADFMQITSIHRSFLSDDSVRQQLVVRLSSIATMQLQAQLSEHFGRKFGYDHEDECPKTGWYSCSTCFHAGRSPEKRHFATGQAFGQCHSCGEAAAFVHVGEGWPI